MINHVTGTASKINAAKTEESASIACLQPTMDLIDQETGDVNAIFGGNGGLRCGS